MADPTIPGDNNKNNGVENDQETITPIEAAQEAVAQTVEIEADAQPEQPEPQEEELELNTPDDDAKPAVMAGLSQDEIGLNAQASVAPPIQDGAQAPSAQDLKNTQDEEESVFTASPHNNSIAMEQINKGLQGAAHGHIAGVMGATQETMRVQEERKKEQERNLNIAVISAAINDLDKLHKDLDDLMKMREALQGEINKAKEQLNQLVTDLRSAGRFEDAQTIEDVIEMKEYVVVDFKGSEHIVHQDENDPDMMYIVERDSGERVYINEMKPEAREQAWKDINGQRGQKFGNDDPERARELEKASDKLKDDPALQRSFNDANQRLYEKEQALDDLDKQIADKQNEIKDFVAERTQDGTLSQADALEALEKLNDPNLKISDERRTELATTALSSIASSGTKIVDDAGNEVSSDDILSRWQELQQKEQELVQTIEQTDQAIEETTADIQVIDTQIAQSDAQIDAKQQEIDATNQQLAELQKQLENADANVARETAELQQIEKDTQTVEKALDTHGSVFGFMVDKHELTEGIQGLKAEESEFLMHEGKHVYMDNETQAFYTLSIGENGEQLQNYIKDPVADMHLKAQIFAPTEEGGGKYPANFVANAPVESIHDTFRGTQASSIAGAAADKVEDVASAVSTFFGGDEVDLDVGMSPDQLREASAKSLQEQKDIIASQTRPALEQKREQHIAQREQIAQQIKALEDQKNSQQLEQNQLIAQKQQQEHKKAASEEKLVDVREEMDQIEAVAQKENVDLPEGGDQQTEQRSADEALVLNTPEYHLDQAEASHNKALSAIEAAVASGGALTQDQYDDLSKSPGMSPEKLDAMMAEHKVELNDFASNVKLESDTNALSQATPQQGTPINVQHFGQTVPHTTIPSTTLTPDPNGVQPEVYTGSFADSAEFAATNPTSGPEPSYMEQINNHVQGLTNAVSSWFDAQNDEPKVAQGGMTPEQQEQLRLQAQGLATTLPGTTQNDPQNNNPTTNTGGGMMG